MRLFHGIVVLMLLPAMVWAGELEDIIQEAELKISHDYKTELARESALKKLRRIIENDQLSEAEQISRIKATFLKTADWKPVTEQNAARLIHVAPLTWTIHSLGIEYDVKNVKQILFSAETLQAMEEKQLSEQEQSEVRARTSKKTNSDIDRVSTQQGFRMPQKISVAGVLDSVVSLLIPKVNMEGVHASSRQYASSSEKKNSWSKGEQRMLRSRFEQLSKTLESTEISRCHLRFAVTFHNNLNTDMGFSAKSFVPVYADSRLLLNALPVDVPEIVVLPSKSFTTVTFRGDLDNTRALELMRFMCGGTPDIRMHEGQLLIKAGEVRNVIGEVLRVRTAPITFGNMKWQVLLKDRDHAVTVREALWAVNALYQEPIFTVADQGCGLARRFTEKIDPQRLLVLVELDGKVFDFTQLTGTQLSRNFPDSGLSVMAIDLKEAKLRSLPEECKPIVFQRLKSLAENDGIAWAQSRLGGRYYWGEGVQKNHAEAVRWYRKAAEQGLAEAQFLLGGAYAFGDGVEENYVEAVKWWRKAAAQGNADAQYFLGVTYAFGKGVEKDPVEAVKWYRKAVEQGHDFAQFNLGRCYYFGTGVEKNLAEAVKWYRKAADQGYATAQFNLGLCYAKGDGVAEDPAEAVKWIRKAAEQGDAKAQALLGACYADGIGVEKNPAEGVKWIRKAAEQGLAEAQAGLGECYTRGDGVEKNPAEAVKWYRKAAEQGLAMAQLGLGECYTRGDGVEKNPAEAVKWWRKAAEQGLPEVQVLLGACYELGEGVKRDRTEAVKWYRKAAAQGHKAAIERLKEMGE